MPNRDADPPTLPAIDLGRMPYADAYRVQQDHHAEVLAAREAGHPEPGRVLLVEHDPVITVSRRPGARDHLLATPDLLARHGVDVQATDRGGDITYHGPGQLVCYPLLDLNAVGLRLIEHVRLLESAIIATLGTYGLEGVRDPGATGVWVPNGAGDPERKIAAIGIRVRRWISMHGLSLNVDPDLSHYGLIVPCGLAGRPVTSMRRELGDACPPMGEVKGTLVDALRALVRERLAAGARAQERSPGVRPGLVR